VGERVGELETAAQPGLHVAIDGLIIGAILRSELAEIISKYRRSPEFMFIDLADVNQKGMTGDTLLHSAVVNGVLADVQILISCGASVNAAGDLCSTPLHYAASRGMAEIARELLKSGADVDIRNEFGQTALDLAELRKRHEVVRIFKANKKRN
jgi:ankyrin repeat protein